VTTKDQILNWIERINKSKKRNENIVAYNFGLFETAEGYTVYLTGSESFDENDDDWAANIDFEPKEKYLELPSTESKGKDWEEILNVIYKILTDYLQSESFRKSILKDAEVITVGFDDSDLIRIK